MAVIVDNIYTLRLFFNGLQGGRPKPYLEMTIGAFSPTEAMNRGKEEAKRQGADHFNINLGEPDYEEEATTNVSRKK